MLGPKKAGKRSNPIVPIILLILFLILIYYFSMHFFNKNAESSAKDVVTTFYEYEQKGDFGSSWSLFHSQMKDRFDKASYIQARAHVLLEDLSSNGFTFELGDPEELKTWKMAEGNSPLSDVSRIHVTQIFHSMFGTFSIEQDVFVVKEKGEWRVLWSYK